ncbi:MAG: T9SS type A sorting domain-containing protein [Candidatus Kapabacteria bacterium]|nr:T9SS type A sorting domain-containing protein [Candidatus Kapabacteria bacterium]
MRRIIAICGALLVCATISANAQGLVLQHLGRHTQRPATYDGSAAETVSYDPTTRQAVITDVKANRITYVNMANPASPVSVRDVLLTQYGGTVNSVAIRNGLVAVALEDITAKSNPGKVVFFDMQGNFRSSVTVGALPDQLVFTPNGQRVIVCNEGEPELNYTVDPEGSVSIINVTNPTAPTVQTVSFASLNGRQDSLRAMGIRIYGPNATVAQDFEPEYAAITSDGSTAYVTLQENNAIAVIDINNAALLRVMALGYKDHSRGLPRSTNYTWRNRPVLGTTPGGQTINLGGFSGLWFEGFGSDTNKLRFLTHPDRGPNGEPFVWRGATRRPFALPNFQCEVVRFELDRVTGAFTILDRVKLTRADGTTPITGLPNLQAGAQGLAYTDEFPIDLNGNDLPNDPFGADLEGISVDAQGTWWMVDEYRPAIYNFNSQGRLLDRYIPAGTAASVSAPAGAYGNEALPAVYAKRRANRGFEACAIEGDILYAFIQTSLDDPDFTNDATSKASPWCRILAFNTVTKQVVGEYLYPMFEKFGSCDKIGDAVSLGAGKFFVVERDDATGLSARKYVFEINLKGATNLQNAAALLPAGKTWETMTFAELAAVGVRPVKKAKAVYLPGVGYGGVDKVEGLARINATTFAVINDNDFGVGGAILPNPPNGSITVNTSADPILGLITFDRPNGLDASDRDNTAGTGANIKIQNYPVYGMYQPDAISAVTVGGSTVLVTANEGDARDWGSFVEEVRGGAANYIIDADLLNAWPGLKSNQLLGRLNVVNNIGDIDGDGDFDEIYALGGRSFSVWNTDGNLLFDSGSDFETRLASLFPANFNTGHTTNAMDDRSDNKGPEPEAIASAVINDSAYVFVGLERMGGVFMYNITNPTGAAFVDYLNPRNFTVTPSLANIDNSTVGDLGPEIVQFVPASESPNNADMLLVSNEVSGTLSAYGVRVPRILTQPAATINHCIPDRLTLAVTASGLSLTYQWFKDGVAVVGATGATYSVDVVNATFAGNYTCRVQSGTGLATTSTPTNVRVFTRTRILTEPRALTQIDANTTVNLSLTATTTAGETFQWFRSTTALNDDQKFSGTRTPNLTIRVATIADTSSRYYCVVTGGCATVRSRDARVLIPKITITQQPLDTIVCPKDTIVLRVAATTSGGDAGIGYQWRTEDGLILKNGSAISGATSNTLRISNPTAADSRKYVCVVTGFPSLLNLFSRSANVIVRTPPTITRQPLAKNGLTQDTVCAGMVFQFGVVAEGVDLTYQWYRNGARIPLADFPTYSSREPGTYYVEVAGTCGLLTRSQSVSMQNIIQPSVGLQPPYERKVKEGTALELSITVAKGSEPMTYQWAVDGQDIIGANALTLRIPSVKLSDAGRYVCVIRNECGIDVSNACLVTVYKDNPTSVDEDLEGAEMTIAPMPVQSSSTIRVSGVPPGNATLSIIDVTGRVVSNLEATVANTGTLSLALTPELFGSAGTYVVRLRTAAGEISRTIVYAP